MAPGGMDSRPRELSVSARAALFFITTLHRAAVGSSASDMVANEKLWRDRVFVLVSCACQQGGLQSVHDGNRRTAQWIPDVIFSRP